jgi:NADPH2:quinone reductase
LTNFDARSLSLYLEKEMPMETLALKKTATNSTLPITMKAAAIDGYGGPEMLKPHNLPVPQLGHDEVLIEVAAAGVGVWDGMQREGKMARMEPGGGNKFPLVLGADGAGTVKAVGTDVKGFKPGDAVYGYSFLSPKGGFDAQYAAVPADAVAKIPKGLDVKQAGVLGVTGVTALRGLDDHLRVKRGHNVLIFGASGGVGDPAVQLAKAMGANVLAVVASDDGATLATQSGADVVVNTKRDDLTAALQSFAPNGLDALLATVNGDGLDKAIAGIKKGGRLAHPNGVQPAPKAGPGVEVSAYDGTPDRKLLDKLNRLIESRPFKLHLSGTFPLEKADEAHRELAKHHLGRMVLTTK